MKWIRDNLYGDIPINDLIERIIDTSHMQRLRRLAQIPFASLVYPGANHTRFEHSLGTYVLTERFCKDANLDKETSEKLTLYALLHDVGHFAFPHLFEGIIKSKKGIGHEEWGQEIIRKTEIADILKDYGFNPNEIAGVPDTKIGEVITGDLGSDRMDYLQRDSKNTGVAYGTIDADRIMRKETIVDGEIVLDGSAMLGAESMLMGRFMMFASVYNHKTRASAALMMKKAVEIALSNKEIDTRDIMELDDHALIYKLLNGSNEVKQLVTDILNRKLYKRAFEKRLKQFKNWLFLGGIKREQIHFIEEEIAERAGVGEEDVIVYIPKPWFKSPNMRVLYNGEKKKMHEVSLILRVLNEAQWDYVSVYILVKPDLVDKVRPIASDVMKDIETRRF